MAIFGLLLLAFGILLLFAGFSGGDPIAMIRAFLNGDATFGKGQ